MSFTDIGYGAHTSYGIFSSIALLNFAENSSIYMLDLLPVSIPIQVFDLIIQVRLETATGESRATNTS